MPSGLRLGHSLALGEQRRGGEWTHLVSPKTRDSQRKPSPVELWPALAFSYRAFSVNSGDPWEGMCCVKTDDE